MLAQMARRKILEPVAIKVGIGNVIQMDTSKITSGMQQCKCLLLCLTLQSILRSFNLGAQ